MTRKLNVRLLMSAAAEWKSLRWRRLSWITCRYTDVQFKTHIAEWNCWVIHRCCYLWEGPAVCLLYFLDFFCRRAVGQFKPEISFFFLDSSFLCSCCLIMLTVSLVSPPTQLFFFFFLSSASLPRLPMLEWLAALLILDILSDECCRLIRRSGNDRQNLP